MKVVYTILFGLLLITPLQAQKRAGALVNRANLPSAQLPEKFDESAWSRATFLPPRQAHPIRDSVIGEQFQAGDTYWDLQANYTVGKLIALDDSGDIHVTWMDGFTEVTEDDRFQKYNYFDNGAFTQGEDGVTAVFGTRSGYGCIALTNEADQRAMVFCHATGILDVLTSFTSLDFSRGAGAFETFPMPNFPEVPVIWPQGVCSPGGRLHVVYDREGGAGVSYTSSDFNDGMIQYPDTPIQLTTTPFIAYRIASSQVSERAAIIFPRARHGGANDTSWSNWFPGQINNDLMLVTTEDGYNWNFDDPYNITQCIGPNSALGEDSMYCDTLRPAFHFDLIFDQNDMLHVVFNTYGVWEIPDWEYAEHDSVPWAGFTRDATMIYHWTEEDCTFAPVADGWFSQAIPDPEDTTQTLIHPMPEGNRANVCNPSLGYDETGNLYCVFNYYPYGDYNDYVGRNIRGRCHGDVSATVSTDNGRTWYHPTRLVETTTPLPEPGEAMSEVFPTIAERNDDYLHIFYILDKEGGSDILNDLNASNTLNPAIYLRTPTAEIAMDSIFIAPNFHFNGERVRSVANEPVFTPAGFRLTGAYPNPFNNQSVIKFDLDRNQMIELALYTLDGRQAKVIYAGSALRGSHEIKLDGSGLAAGLYLVRLSGGGSTATLKLALVK